MGAASDGPAVESIAAHAFEIPTDGPEGQEQDGTLSWSSTVIVLVEARAGHSRGLGYTYGDASVARLSRRAVAGPGALPRRLRRRG